MYWMPHVILILGVFLFIKWGKLPLQEDWPKLTVPLIFIGVLMLITAKTEPYKSSIWQGFIFMLSGVLFVSFPILSLVMAYEEEKKDREEKARKHQ